MTVPSTPLATLFSLPELLLGEKLFTAKVPDISGRSLESKAPRKPPPKMVTLGDFLFLTPLIDPLEQQRVEPLRCKPEVILLLSQTDMDVKTTSFVDCIGDVGSDPGF